MRGDQLARLWRILRTIESRKHGATVAELAAEEDCHARTISGDFAATQATGFPLYSEKDGSKSRWGIIEGYKFHLPVPNPFTIGSEPISTVRLSRLLGPRRRVDQWRCKQALKRLLRQQPTETQSALA